jgi:uncharacterized protein (TIGR03086 family)
MTVDADPLDSLSLALEQTGAIIANVRADQASLPTPCARWDVRALINHVVLDVQHFTASASGERWEAHETDVIGDDWAGACRRAADELLEAWRRHGVAGRTMHLPFGDMPASWSVSQHIADVVVHGWDVARATGQPIELDPDVGELALEWARQSLKPEFRGDEESGRSFGPEVAVRDDAPVHDRLVGFFGRDPDWRP